MDKIKLNKPTADEVFLYTHIMRQNPQTDQQEMMKVLQMWLDGNLEVEKLNDVKTMDLVKDATCAACIVGCCGFFICNPYCIAGCVAGICKP